MKKNKTKIIEKINHFLFEKEEIIIAYLLGSFITKDHYHDIDIAVYLKEDFNKNDFDKFPYGYGSGLISELNQLVKEKIDFIVMNNSSITLQQRIVNKGILLFSKDRKKQISYENYIRKLYRDSENIRRIKKKYLLKKLNNA